MGSGNVKVLEETLKSFVGSGICTDVVYGDLLIFPEDRKIVELYQEKYNIKIVRFPFDYIFASGFSSLLNVLAAKAKNNLVIYMNTSEVISIDYGVNDIVNNNPDCNTFFFTHAVDPHRWHRLYDRRELRWSGMIHEEVVGEHRPYHKPIFQMADLEKDLDNTLKAKVFNDVKEMVYFQQYINLIDFPERQGGTNSGWLSFAKDNYESMMARLKAKGARYEAFIEQDYDKYMKDIMTNPEFEKERFESSVLIDFQGDKKTLL